ncbi:TetR family transcriptional regulator [Nakamurella sp. YIM 132087]|uniref:TetR family transcriptional regulator n=1 Tax=Nakamurella alba TaxID=2665158 RepID=A0A7K1FH73_9ACTN|nr:TetR/AcrR family transcriptional regulator [Nakamurella alba]MTD13448.1 TetR family transcriptional regulator [Nakamurella alba]
MGVVKSVPPSGEAAGAGRRSAGGRRPRNTLTRDDVVAAAVALVEREGLPALSFRGLAAALGSSAMAIYNHVAGREDLLVAMAEFVTADLPTDVPGSAPRERMIERWVRTHDVLVEHSWVLQVLIEGQLVPENSFSFADRSIGDLLEAGLTPGESIHAHGVCWHLMLGEILDRHPADMGERPTQRERALLAMDPVRLPHYAHVLQHLDPSDGPPPCRFRYSVGLLIDGLLAGH